MPDKADLIREAIDQANWKLQGMFLSGNVHDIGQLYTEDAVLMPPGSEPVQGTAAIADFWEMVRQMGVKEIKIETEEFDAQGATVIEIGQYTLRDEGQSFIDRGKYIVIWKLIKGEWKLHRDIWNSNLSQK